MTKYLEIITSLKEVDVSKSEFMEEEIDIMIHKLKFLSQDNLPKTIILDQDNNYLPVISSILEEKVKIAGGRSISDLNQNPDCMIIIQRNDNLYSQLPELIQNQHISESSAFKNNNIFIIQKTNFNTSDQEYLQDTEILAEIIQPKYFVFGHQDIHWVKFD